MPSKRPPVGCESACEPVITGSAFGLRPARRMKTLPIWSTVTVQPASLAQLTIRSRLSLSRSVSARRQTPPLGVAPIFAIVIRLSHRRLPSILIDVSGSASFNASDSAFIRLAPFDESRRPARLIKLVHLRRILGRFRTTTVHTLGRFARARQRANPGVPASPPILSSWTGCSRLTPLNQCLLYAAIQ